MSVAKAYARALYESAVDSKGKEDVKEIETQLTRFQEVLDSSREMRIALLSGTTAPREKEAVVSAIARKAEYSPLLGNFLVLLARKERMAALGEIIKAFTEVRLEAEGSVLGSLESAEPLDQKDIDSLAKAFEKKLGRRVAFQPSVDETLLAGVRVTVSGVTYDGTLRSQLQRLRDRLVYGTEGVH